MKKFKGIFILLLIVYLTFARKITKSFRLQWLKQQPRTLYLSKFDIGVGRGSIDVRIKDVENLSLPQSDNQRAQYLKLGILKYDDIDTFFALQKCNQRKIKFSQIKDLKLQQKAHQRFAIEDNQIERFWFLYVFDCFQYLGPQAIPNSSEEYQLKGKVQVAISMKNNGSNFGENQNLIPQYCIIVAIWLIATVFLFMPVLKSLKKTFQFNKLAVYLSFGIMGVSYFYRFLTLIVIDQNGQTITFLDNLSSIIRFICEGMVMIAMISIVQGWSVSHQRLSRSTFFIGIYVIIANSVCEIVGKVDEQQVYHSFDFFFMPIIVSFRCAVVLLFWYYALDTYNKNAGIVKHFIKQFTLRGTIYLLATPLSHLFAEIFLPHHKQKQFIIFFEELFHLIGIIMMCHTFAYPTSGYKKVDKEDASELPG